MSDAKMEIILAAKNASQQAFAEVRKSIDGLGNAFSVFKNLAVTSFAGVSFAKLGADALKAASELEEAGNKFDVVFGEHGRKSSEALKQLTESYAMSRREAMQYLAGVQDLLVPLGVAGDKSADLSREIVKLAADLGSFNNLPTAQVIENIQSALVGEYDAMKKYGVVVNEQIAKERALALGLAKTTDEVSAAHKAYAAFTLMVEGSQAAIGDMDRTAGSAANQWKRWRANIEDWSATVGKVFLPAANAVLEAVNKMASDKNIAVLERQSEAYRGQAAALAEVAKFSRGMANPEALAGMPGMPKFSGDPEKALRDLQQYNHALREAISLEEHGASIKSQITIPKVSTEDFIKNAMAISKATGKLKEYKTALGAGQRPYTESEAVLADQRRFEEWRQDWSGYGQRPFQESEAVLADQTRFEEWKKSFEDSSNYIMEISERTANAVEQNFSDFFFDAFSGQLKTAEDYFKAFSNSVARMAADMAGQMLKTGLFGASGNNQQAGGLFGALLGAAGTGGGGGGFLESLFGSSGAGWQPTTAAISARGNVFAAGGLKKFGLGGIFEKIFGLAGGSSVESSLFKALGFGVMSALATPAAAWQPTTPLIANAYGNVFGPGGLKRYAAGGVVARPTVFPFAGGVGLMGEEGPEAIMPLKRGPSGRLGVEATGSRGGGNVQVTVINNSGAPASVRESVTAGPGGGRQVFVTVGRDIMGGGPIAQAIERTYGVRRIGRLG